MTATDQGLDCLNALLRGEIAATETYQQAIDKMDATPNGSDLRRIHIEHREAANMLRTHVHECGGTPDQSSSTWGVWAKLVEGAAKLFGNAATVKALKEGEEQGRSDYENALKHEGLSDECKYLIRTQLLPQTAEHIGTLDRILATG